MNTYDALVIFPSQLKDEELDKALDRLKKEVARAGGEVTGSRLIGRRSFTRPLNKKDAGVYIRLGVQMPPDAMTGFLARVKLQEEVFRMQITRVEPEKLIKGDGPAEPSIVDRTPADVTM